MSEAQGSITDELQMNTTTSGDRGSACVATTPDSRQGGYAFVVWVESNQTGGITVHRAREAVLDQPQRLGDP
jgi:hypothetical protein